MDTGLVGTSVQWGTSGKQALANSNAAELTATAEIEKKSLDPGWRQRLGRGGRWEGACTLPCICTEAGFGAHRKVIRKYGVSVNHVTGKYFFWSLIQIPLKGRVGTKWHLQNRYREVRPL